jgi:hypothetical protein
MMEHSPVERKKAKKIRGFGYTRPPGLLGSRNGQERVMGFEPTTTTLATWHSTTELHPQFIQVSNIIGVLFQEQVFWQKSSSNSSIFSSSSPFGQAWRQGDSVGLDQGLTLSRL